MLVPSQMIKAVCGIAALTLWGHLPAATGMAWSLHPSPALHKRPPPRPNPRPSRPLPGQEWWRPDLDDALQALLAADQAMRSSTAMDLPGAVGHLKAALRDLQPLPPIFNGHRAVAARDAQRAINHLLRHPPNPAAIGLTEQAIKELQACELMHR